MKTKVEFPDFTEMIETYDILCISETFLDETENISVPGYSFLSKPRKMHYYRKSGGLGIFVKSTLSQNIELIETDSEYGLWIKLKKSLLSLDQDIVIGAIYVPPEQSRFCNDDEWLLLNNEITDLNNRYDYLILTGDMNARTGQENDYISADEFLLNHFGLNDESITFFDRSDLLTYHDLHAIRTSKDATKNSNGRKLLELCRNNNLFILNGRCDMDKNIGQYTYRESSVIDYSIVSANCVKLVLHFQITETDDIFSDGHSLISTTLRVPDVRDNSADRHSGNRKKPTWKNENKDTFVRNIDLNKVQNLITLSRTATDDSQCTISDIANNISSLFEAASNQPSHKPKASPTPNSNIKAKPWFGPRCRNHRLMYNRAKKLYNSHETVENKHQLKSTSKQYKKIMNIEIKKYKSEMEAKIRKLEKQNPKAYWKYINSLKSKNNQSKTPTLAELHDHFRNVYSSNETDTEPEGFNLHSNLDQLNRHITADEITKCIKNLKNGKCAADDNILN